MALSTASQAAVVITAFLLPIITYLLFTRGLSTNSQHSKSRGPSAGPVPPPTEITKILIHPIKSCHGISVPAAKLLPTGLDLDRHWMWVSVPDHKFLTIRALAKMTLIRPSYDASTDALTITAPAPTSTPSSSSGDNEGTENGNENLSITIPAHPSLNWLKSNTSIIDVTVWSTTTPAYAYSPSLTEPFNAFFGRSIRLVYKPPFDAHPRPLVSNGAPKVLGRDASTIFPDLMPVLVGSEASIAELNARLKKAGEEVDVEIERFRPNIIVKGEVGKPWDEDRWKTLRIAGQGQGKGGGQDDLVLDITQRCARCRVPNVDPETAEEHKRQPWDTLMKYRRIDEGITFKPCFGMLCVPRGDGGEVKVGQKLEVTEVTYTHRYIAGF